MNTGTLSVANEIKTQIEEYVPIVHLLNYILTQGMKQRHWDIFADITGEQLLIIIIILILPIF